MARCSKRSRWSEARCEALPGRCVFVGGEHEQREERRDWRAWWTGLCCLWEKAQIESGEPMGNEAAAGMHVS